MNIINESNLANIAKPENIPKIIEFRIKKSVLLLSTKK